MARQLYTARLVREEMLSERAQCKHLQFAAEGMDRFDFKAGQFVSMVAPNSEGKQITRAYSIASGPNEGPHFDLCLNRVEGGFFSNHLCDMKEGDTVQFHGPHGLFVLRNPLRDCIMIATGTGIAPFRSMLKTHLAAHPDQHFTLIFGVRYERNIMYRDEFEMMAADHPKFRFWPTLSRPDDSWAGRSGHVQTHLMEAIGDRRDMDVYICGMKLMVDDVRARLKELGFDRKHIIFEKYD